MEIFPRNAKIATRIKAKRKFFFFFTNAGVAKFNLVTMSLPCETWSYIYEVLTVPRNALLGDFTLWNYRITNETLLL